MGFYITSCPVKIYISKFSFDLDAVHEVRIIVNIYLVMFLLKESMSCMQAKVHDLWSIYKYFYCYQNIKLTLHYNFIALHLSKKTLG